MVSNLTRLDPPRHHIHLTQTLPTTGHRTPLRNQTSLPRVPTSQNTTRFTFSMTETSTSSAGQMIVAPSSGSIVNGWLNTPQSCLAFYRKTSFIKYRPSTVGRRSFGTMVRWNSPLYWRWYIDESGCLAFRYASIFVECILRFPFGANRPPFREFSSLLRMSTKYQISSIRDVLLTNLRTTHAAGLDAGDVTPIYHGYFGDPRPHPNEVLRLFHECRVDFALPFAFYEACVAGIKSLTNTDPSIKLPPVTLSQAVRGFCTIKEWEWRFARGILFLDRQTHTSKRCRPLDLRSTDSGSPLQDVLRAMCPGFGVTAGGLLHVLDFPKGDNCADCVRRWNDVKQQTKMELQKSLPEIFGMGHWAEIYSNGNGAT